MRSKTMFLGLLNEEQIKQNKTPTTIIRPVLTRWTAHLRAYERILGAENAIMSVILTELGRAKEHRRFITGDRRSKEKARQMVEIIRNSLFWHNLARYDFFFFLINHQYIFIDHLGLHAISDHWVLPQTLFRQHFAGLTLFSSHSVIYSGFTIT